MKSVLMHHLEFIIVKLNVICHIVLKLYLLIKSLNLLNLVWKSLWTIQK